MKSKATISIIKKLLDDSTLSENLKVFVLAQSKHETAVVGVPFMSLQYITYNNAFGYGAVKNNKLQMGISTQHPEDKTFYARYASLQNSVLDIVGYYNRRKALFVGVTTPEQFVNVLKSQNYFTDTTANYLRGIKHFI